MQLKTYYICYKADYLEENLNPGVLKKKFLWEREIFFQVMLFSAWLSYSFWCYAQWKQTTALHKPSEKVRHITDSTDKDCHHPSCDTLFWQVPITGNKCGIQFPTVSIHKTRGAFKGTSGRWKTWISVFSHYEKGGKVKEREDGSRKLASTTSAYGEENNERTPGLAFFLSC